MPPARRQLVKGLTMKINDELGMEYSFADGFRCRCDWQVCEVYRVIRCQVAHKWPKYRSMHAWFDSEDIVQEVWVKLLKSKGGVGNSRAYLSTLVDTVLVDHYRYVHAAKRFAATVRLDDVAELLCVRNEDLPLDVDVKEVFEAIRHTCTERERKVLTLREEGMSSEKIGEQMGLTTGAVRAIWGRLAEKVRRTTARRELSMS